MFLGLLALVLPCRLVLVQITLPLFAELRWPPIVARFNAIPALQ
jgi:hypothetical protein